MQKITAKLKSDMQKKEYASALKAANKKVRVEQVSIRLTDLPPFEFDVARIVPRLSK